jgi:hypothetical protein
MNSPLSLIFYALFALVVIWIYLAVRRGWTSPGFILGAGTAGTIITILLMSVSQGNEALHAVVNGIVVGSIFSLGTFALATYFSRRERKTA